mmetsp:Transcript_152954/g.292934  ORF Transcript_152954/g.292934 Transcript_152954/m.292934 type:complete len:627 (-) Transcript_152954:205-2085(-)
MGWVYVSNLPRGPAEHVASLFMGGWKSLTHFGLLLCLPGADCDNWLQLERLSTGVVFRKLLLGYPLCNGAVLAYPFKASNINVKDLANFVEQQMQIPYRLDSKNCKHLTYDFFTEVLHQRQSAFGAFCSKIEEHFLDWVLHPLGPALLQSNAIKFDVALPVALRCGHTEAAYVVWKDENVTELLCGNFNKWSWGISHLKAPGATVGQCLTVVGSESVRHIFYMMGKDMLSELVIGKDTQWRWRQYKHSVQHASRGVPVAAGMNAGSLSVFWAGNKTLYEFHKGHYDGWKWQLSQHHAPSLTSGQPLAAICNNFLKKVFWMSSGNRIYEFHMGVYNRWQWSTAEHHAPGSGISHSLAASVDCKGEYVFWASKQDTIQEMYNTLANAWTWKLSEHAAPYVTTGQRLAVECASGGKRVFWLDAHHNLQQLHQRAQGWQHKSLACGSEGQLPWSNFALPAQSSKCPCYLPNTVFKSCASSLVLSQSIKVGDTVLSCHGTHVTVAKKITHPKSKQSLVKLTTAQCSTEIAAAHRVPVAAGQGMRVASELTEGDIVYVGSCERPLTKVGRYMKRTELIELSFHPDEPVESFLAPTWAIHTLGDPINENDALEMMRHNLAEELVKAMPDHYED